MKVLELYTRKKQYEMVCIEKEWLFDSGCPKRRREFCFVLFCFSPGQNGNSI